MANLKDLRQKITSVKSTKRITSAMKLVAAAKLKKATLNVDSANPYANEIEKTVTSLAGNCSVPPLLMKGRKSNNKELIVVVSSDKGLCGGLNVNITRNTIMLIENLKRKGKNVELLIIGKKANSSLKVKYSDIIVKVHTDVFKTAPSYEDAKKISSYIIDKLENNEIGACKILYSKFVSAISQVPIQKPLIPLKINKSNENNKKNDNVDEFTQKKENVEIEKNYEYEPSQEDVLKVLLPKNLTVQIFRSMLENFASEQGARMAAMDNATRNADDMINTLTTKYNRTRQAQVTNELVEIISGAEAL